jgi:hypothetical protein
MEYKDTVTYKKEDEKKENPVHKKNARKAILDKFAEMMARCSGEGRHPY